MRAEQLQIIEVVSTAFGTRQDMIDFHNLEREMGISADADAFMFAMFMHVNIRKRPCILEGGAGRLRANRGGIIFVGV